MSNRYSIYPARFTHAGGTLHLPQMGRARDSANNQLDEIIVGGSVDRGAVILQTAAPSADLETADLVTVFGTISPTAGLKCTGACELQYQLRAEQAVFQGGATNVTLNATGGFLAVTNLAASGSGRATCGLRFFPLFDGTNQPVIANNSVALEGAAAFNSAFYQGPCYINGVQVNGLVGQSIDFAIGFGPDYADGDVFPRRGFIRGRMTLINLTFKNLAHISAVFGSRFISALSGTIDVYFVKGKASDIREPNASTVHCKVSAASGAVTPDDVDVQGNDDGTVTVSVRPTAALAVSVASALP